MYYFIYSLLWIFSLLPLSVLYLIGDLFYLLIFYGFKYRRNVVMNNLGIAFPEKTEAQRLKIAKQFYHNFIDSMMESIKFITISRKEIERRSSCEYELLNELIAKGRNIHMMAGHQFNWEFANLQYAMNLSIPFVGIYMTIANKAMNRIFFDIRKRYGTVLISAQDFKNKMFDVFSSQYVLGLAADQNPGNPAAGYWMNFMGKPVPFVAGPAKGAVKNNTAVVIVGFYKRSRGYYTFKAKLLADEGSQYTPEQLTLMYKNALEEVIRQDPANYLWSHRRWKYDWKPEYGPVIE